MAFKPVCGFAQPAIVPGPIPKNSITTGLLANPRRHTTPTSMFGTASRNDLASMWSESNVQGRYKKSGSNAMPAPIPTSERTDLAPEKRTPWLMGKNQF